MPQAAHRSLLFVPGHKAGWVEKAVRSGADAIVLDLEDSVPREHKAQARATVAESIAALAGEPVAVYVRPNALASGLTGLDMQAAAQPGLRGFFVPKVASATDAIRYETLSDNFAGVAGLGRVELIIPVETAAAIAHCEDIAAASGATSAMVGPTAEHADIARAVGYRWTAEGLETLYLRSRVLIACRASGLQPLTGLWEDVHDLDGLREFARFGRQLGFRGQVVIHPSHVPIVNEAYGDDEAELEFYRGLVEAFEEAERRGDAAVLYRGRHIDQAHADNARERLAAARRAG